MTVPDMLEGLFGSPNASNPELAVGTSVAVAEWGEGDRPIILIGFGDTEVALPIEEAAELGDHLRGAALHADGLRGPEEPEGAVIIGPEGEEPIDAESENEA